MQTVSFRATPGRLQSKCCVLDAAEDCGTCQVVTGKTNVQRIQSDGSITDHSS